MMLSRYVCLPGTLFTTRFCTRVDSDELVPPSYLFHSPPPNTITNINLLPIIAEACSWWDDLQSTLHYRLSTLCRETVTSSTCYSILLHSHAPHRLTPGKSTHKKRKPNPQNSLHLHLGWSKPYD
ncbi:unnamed protein product [Ectocarpus sp. 8 AP-2014]